MVILKILNNGESLFTFLDRVQIGNELASLIKLEVYVYNTEKLVYVCIQGNTSKNVHGSVIYNNKK